MNKTRKYHHDGFVVIKNFISKNEARLFSQYIDRYVSKYGSSLKGKEINWLDKEQCIANSVHKTDLDPMSPVTKLLHSNKMKDLVGELLSEEAIERCAEFFCKPARLGLASPMHQDNFYWCLCCNERLKVDYID